MTERRYTRELLEEAARETRTWDEAVRWCGGESTRYSRRYVRLKMVEAGIDVSHFPTRSVRHTESALRAAVEASTNIKEVVRLLGISNVGGNQAHIGRRIRQLGIDTSHFSRAVCGPRAASGDILTLRPPREGRVHGIRLRREMLGHGIPDRCALCGGTEWNGEPIPLEVDHVDGNWWDNRLENLRLLCPNCHAVTDTYRGRKRGPV